MSPIPSTQEIIQHFDLIPHFEGGYYKETYRSSDRVLVSHLPARFASPLSCPPEPHPDRNICTGVLYLLSHGQRSKLHRIKADEMWHYYLGTAPLYLVMLTDGGELSVVTMGSQICKGEHLQFVVPGGVWFGAFMTLGSVNDAFYALVGCTVSPGFDLNDFEFSNRLQLESLMRDPTPEQLEIIHYLTDPSPC